MIQTETDLSFFESFGSEEQAAVMYNVKNIAKFLGNITVLWVENNRRYLFNF